VKAWPDECVGDFARCYDLADPNHTMCPALHELLENRRNRRKLEAAEHQQQHYPNEDFLEFDFDALVPAGTTHISVDCTIDKKAILENLYQQQEFKRQRYRDKVENLHQQQEFERQQQELERQRYRDKVHAQKEKTLFAVASILGAVLITIYAISQMVVQPIVGVLRESIGRNNNNNTNNNNIGYGGNNHQLVSRMVPRTNSGLRIETDGDEFGMQDEIQTFHDVTETTIDPIPMDFDAVPIAPSRSPSPQQHQQTPLNVDTVSVLPTVHVSPQQQQPEFQQIPMDFDAVPIVPATIIPIDAIHAEVVQDGVTYYP